MLLGGLQLYTTGHKDQTGRQAGRWLDNTGGMGITEGGGGWGFTDRMLGVEYIHITYLTTFDYNQTGTQPGCGTPHKINY